MTEFETIMLATDDRGIATLALNRPAKHNAMSARMISELTEATALIEDEEKIRAVVLTGSGESFCAGGDLAWMQSQFQATRDERIEEATRLATMLRRLNELPKPVIAKVNGQAFGGGVGLMCVCDVVVSADTAMFGLTETRLGLIPATISPYVLARMGEGRVRRVFFSARRFTAVEAIELGLVAKAVDKTKLGEAVEMEVKPYLSTSPQAVAAAKALARSLGPTIDDQIIADTARRLADTWDSEDAQAGVTAFLEKRKPWWVS